MRSQCCSARTLLLIITSMISAACSRVTCTAIVTPSIASALDILKVKSSDVPQLAATLEMLGYAEPVPDSTQADTTVSAAKQPRFN